MTVLSWFESRGPRIFHGSLTEIAQTKKIQFKDHMLLFFLLIF